MTRTGTTGHVQTVVPGARHVMLAAGSAAGRGRGAAAARPASGTTITTGHRDWRRQAQAGAGNRPEEPCRSSAQDQQAGACRAVRQYPRGQAVSQFRGHPALRKHPAGTDGSSGKPDGVSVAQSRGRRVRIRRPAGDGGVVGQHQMQLGAAQPSLPRRPVQGSIGRRRAVHACHDPRPALAACRNPVLLARHLVSFRLPGASQVSTRLNFAPAPPCRQGRRSPMRGHVTLMLGDTSDAQPAKQLAAAAGRLILPAAAYCPPAPLRRALGAARKALSRPSLGAGRAPWVDRPVRRWCPPRGRPR